MSTPVVGLVILGCATVGGVRIAVLGVRAAQRGATWIAGFGAKLAAAVVSAVGAVKLRFTRRARSGGTSAPFGVPLTGTPSDAALLAAIAVALAAIAGAVAAQSRTQTAAPARAPARAPRPVIEVLALPAGRRGRGKRASA